MGVRVGGGVVRAGVGVGRGVGVGDAVAVGDGVGVGVNEGIGRGVKVSPAALALGLAEGIAAGAAAGVSARAAPATIAPATRSRSATAITFPQDVEVERRSGVVASVVGGGAIGSVGSVPRSLTWPMIARCVPRPGGAALIRLARSLPGSSSLARPCRNARASPSA